MSKLKRNCNLFHFILSVAGCLSFFGCSSSQRVVPPTTSALQGDSHYASLDPIEVEVLEEVFDGDVLTVVIGVEPLKDIPSTNLAAQLTFFQDGNQVGREEFALSDLPVLESFQPLGEKVIPANAAQKLLLQSKVPRSGVSDYQVEVSWGPSQPEDSSTEVLRTATVRELAMECSVRCVVPFEVRLDIANPFPKAIRDLRFVTWFEGEERQASEARGHFTLPGRKISSGEAFQVVLKLKTPLPYDLYEKGYRPRVELGSFEFVGKAQ